MDASGLPKCRPVCGASCSINQELSEWVAQILEATLGSGEQSEVISTEDLLSEIDRLNENWKAQGRVIGQDEIFVGSLDAAALYPSLDVAKCSRMCAERIMETQLEFEGVDYEWA